MIAAHPETRAFATRLVENEHTFFTNPDSQDRLKQAFELGKEMRQVVVRVIDGELDYDAGYQKGGRKDTKGQGRDGVSVVGQEEMFKDKGDKLKLIDSDAESSVGSVVAGEEKDDDLEGEGAKGHQVEYGIGWRQLDRFIRGVYDIPDDCECCFLCSPSSPTTSGMNIRVCSIKSKSSHYRERGHDSADPLQYPIPPQQPPPTNRSSSPSTF